MIEDHKKSFLWLTENYPPSRGGMSQSCDRIVHGLREKGFQIHVYHFTNRKKPFITEKKVNGSYTPIPVFESESHTLNLAWNHIRLKKDQFHEIIVFGGYLPIIAAPIFSGWLGVTLITLLRGNDFDISVFSPRRRNLLHEAIIHSKAVGVITMDKIEKISSLYPKVPIYYTPNGIRLEEWNLGKSDLQFGEEFKREMVKDRLCIGVFGQLKEKKGIDILLDSLNLQFLKDHYYLLMIGEAEDVYCQKLVDIGFENKVLPFMDRYEILKYYGVCDVLAIPSHYDGMPNTMLEAGALAIPVIGSNIDGMKDLIVHGENGLLFNPGDKNECRDVFIQFAKLTLDERIALGKNFQMRVQNEYNHYKELENYFKILSDEYKPGILV